MFVAIASKLVVRRHYKIKMPWKHTYHFSLFRSYLCRSVCVCVFALVVLFGFSHSHVRTNEIRNVVVGPSFSFCRTLFLCVYLALCVCVESIVFFLIVVVVVAFCFALIFGIKKTPLGLFGTCKFMPIMLFFPLASLFAPTNWTVFYSGCEFSMKYFSMHKCWVYVWLGNVECVEISFCFPLT